MTIGDDMPTADGRHRPGTRAASAAPSHHDVGAAESLCGSHMASPHLTASLSLGCDYASRKFTPRASSDQL